MKILVLNYSFDASAKQVTFTDYNPIVIERVLLITNITDNVIIYNFADPTKGGTAATNVLTLTYDTASMSDTDKLQIFYDDASTTQPVSGTVTVSQGTATNLKTQSEIYQGGSAVAVGNPMEVTLPSATVTTLTPPAAITGYATSAKQLADNHQVTVSNIASTPVISGFATEATLGTVHGHVDSIDTKTPALGQALAAASVPVILPAATITTLTPPAAITGYATSAKQLADNHQVTVSNIANVPLVDVSSLATSAKQLPDGHSVALSATDNAVLDVIASNTGSAPYADLATLGTPHTSRYYTNAGAVTDGIIWSPAAGKRWYVTDIFIQVSAACTVTLEDDKAAGDTPIWKAELAANSGWSSNFTTPWFSGEDAADLIITTTAGNVYCTICGYEI